MMSPAASNEIESPGWIEYCRASDLGIVTRSLLVTFDMSLFLQGRNPDKALAGQSAKLYTIRGSVPGQRVRQALR